MPVAGTSYPLGPNANWSASVTVQLDVIGRTSGGSAVTGF